MPEQDGFNLDFVPIVIDAITPIWNAYWPWLGSYLLVICVLKFPMLGRGPASRTRDPWRTFRYGARDYVFCNAKWRCEGPRVFVFGRCKRSATEIDHVFPHSKGWPTSLTNGQALCRPCNRAKGNRTPTYWYVKSLERRRRRYFPKNIDVRVYATISDEERRNREPH